MQVQASYAPSKPFPSSVFTNVSKAVSFSPEMGMEDVEGLMTETGKQQRFDYNVSQLPVIGKGSYGKVVKAVNTADTKKSVAIKVIKSKFLRERTHYCLCIFREMYTLRHLNHPNVVRLLDVRAPFYTHGDTEPSTMKGREFEQLDELHLVFESADCDLHQYMTTRRRAGHLLSIHEIKSLFYQLLVAIKYIHSANIIHRDIKPDNLLIWENVDSAGGLQLKLSDFGLSRIVQQTDDSESSFQFMSTSPVDSSHSPATTDTDQIMPPPQLCRDLTKHVVTRWYRAPEVILVQPYGPAVDMWSTGCVLAYLLGHGAPYFPGAPVAPLSVDYKEGEEGRHGGGTEEDNQLSVIFRVIGGPSDEDIALVRDPEIAQYLKTFQHISPEETAGERLPCAPVEALDLLERMLIFDPSRRISVDEALSHPFLASVRDHTVEYEIDHCIHSPQSIEYPPVRQQLKKLVLTKIAEEVRMYNRR